MFMLGVPICVVPAEFGEVAQGLETRTTVAEQVLAEEWLSATTAIPAPAAPAAASPIHSHL